MGRFFSHPDPNPVLLCSPGLVNTDEADDDERKNQKALDVGKEAELTEETTFAEVHNLYINSNGFSSLLNPFFQYFPNLIGVRLPAPETVPRLNVPLCVGQNSRDRFHAVKNFALQGKIPL